MSDKVHSIFENIKYRDRVVGICNNDQDVLELTYIHLDENGNHIFIDESGKLYKFGADGSVSDCSVPADFRFVFNLDYDDPEDENMKVASKKYIFVYFGDNDFTIPFQQAMFVISNALNYNIKMYRNSVINSDESDKEFYMSKIQQFLDPEKFRSILVNTTASFYSLFDITIHGTPDIDAVRSVSEFIEDFEYKFKIYPARIIYGTEQEINKSWQESFMDDWYDGGIWITVNFDNNGNMLSAEGGVNYITDDYLE